MKKEFEGSEKALAQINQVLIQQSKEMSDLREQVTRLIQLNTPKPVAAVIEPDYGYEWMWLSIHLDAETWSRVKAGEHIKIKGNGWVPVEDAIPDPADELFYWDHWEFNGGIGKHMKIFMESPHEVFEDIEDTTAYDGILLKKYVREL